MLCPKCGYITFDELPACPKCKKDWADVAGKLNGFVTMTEAPNFLSKILKDHGVSEVLADDLEEPETLGVSENLVVENSVIGDETINDGISLSDGISMNDNDGLDLAIDELSSLEDEEVESEKQNTDIGLNGGVEFSLDDSESEPFPPALDVDENRETTGPSTVDLHDIDLSDLVEPGVLESDQVRSSGSTVTDEGGAIDDSLSPTDNKVVPDLFGIDLSLEGDGDLLDLSLEPEVKPSDKPVKEKSIIPDLGLSLDLDE